MRANNGQSHNMAKSMWGVIVERKGSGLKKWRRGKVSRRICYESLEHQRWEDLGNDLGEASEWREELSNEGSWRMLSTCRTKDKSWMNSVSNKLRFMQLAEQGMMWAYIVLREGWENHVQWPVVIWKGDNLYRERKTKRY